MNGQGQHKWFFLSLLLVRHDPSPVSARLRAEHVGRIVGVPSRLGLDHDICRDRRRRRCESPALDLDGGIARALEGDSGLLPYAASYGKPPEDSPLSRDFRLAGRGRTWWNRRHLPGGATDGVVASNFAWARWGMPGTKFSSSCKCGAAWAYRDSLLRRPPDPVATVRPELC